MRKLVFLFIMLIAILLLSSCSNSSNPATTSKSDPITISVFMTKNEIIEKLGDNYTFATEIDKCCGNYFSSLFYNDIFFGFSHKQENCPDEAFPSTIVVVSNKYTFSNNFYVGDSALIALSKCEELYSNTYDSDNDTYYFDIFNYKEKNEKNELVDTNYKFRLEYSSDKYFKSKDEITEDTKIELIHIFSSTH